MTLAADAPRTATTDLALVRRHPAIHRGLRRHPDKDMLTVFDLTGRQHPRFRFDRNLRALLGHSPRELREFVQTGFGRLPSGCLVTFEERAQRDILERVVRAIPTDLRDLYHRSRSEGFGPEVKRRILLGTYVLSAGYYDAYYRKAQQVRTLLRRDFEEAFRHCDVLLTPTSPEVAFRIGEKSADPLSMYLSDIYTVTANLAGIPGLSVPCGFAHGLPVGLQILGRALDEATVLRVADAWQRRSDFHLRRPGTPS